MPLLTNDLGRHIRSQRLAVVEEAIRRVLQRGHFILGPEVQAFEAEFAAYCGASHAVGVANGTDALELCLRALGIAPRDRVALVANAGGYSTAAAFALGARPVYVDVDRSSLNLDPADLERVLAAGEVRAIIVTHLYGLLADMPRVMALTLRFGVPVVEDCAQAHGARREGRCAGSWGRLAAFSFYPTKNLGAVGDAGAVVTSDPGLAEAVRELRQYGWSGKYRATRAGGRNSRLDEIQAAILRGFLPLLDGWNMRRREILGRYNDALKGLDVQLPPAPGTDQVVHLYVLRSQRRDHLRQALAEQGIIADIHYPIPDYRQPAVAPSLGPTAPLLVTEECCSRVLTLPCFPEMTDQEVDQVAAIVARALADRPETSRVLRFGTRRWE